MLSLRKTHGNKKMFTLFPRILASTQFNIRIELYARGRNRMAAILGRFQCTDARRQPCQKPENIASSSSVAV